jgi:hypothetical protein
MKKSKFYQMMKTTEAVLVIGVPILFVILGWFKFIPALLLMGLYTLVNLTGYAMEPLWKSRDKIKEEVEKLK